MIILFKFLRNNQSFPQSSGTILYSPQQCIRVSIFHVLAKLIIICLFHYSHPSGCEVISHGGLICISLVTTDVEHLFKCSFGRCICSLEKCLFKSLSIFKTRFCSDSEHHFGVRNYSENLIKAKQ